MAIKHPDAQNMADALNEYEAQALEGIRSLIAYVGADQYSEGLLETPRRVLNAFRELCEGYTSLDKPQQLLSKTFDHDMDQMIVVRDIEFTSLCEHHLLPFQGTATVAYIPNGRVVGLSKLSRVVQYYASRLQIQERLTQQIADAIMRHISPTPLGAACLMSAHHSCMSLRGAKSRGRMLTSVLRGQFMKDASVRQEFLSLVSSKPEG